MSRIGSGRGKWVLAAAAPAVIAAAGILVPHGQARGVAHAARAAPMTTVTCGMEVKTSITMANDLTCQSSSALIVTGGHVTVNMNHHFIAGNLQNPAIFVSAPNVTVMNGTIVASGAAVNNNSLGGGMVVQGMRVSQNLQGIHLSMPHDRATGNLVFANATDGIHSQGTGAQITNNTVRNNGWDGIEVTGDSSMITGNKAENNDRNGINVEGSPDLVTLSGNAADGNGSTGIYTTSDTGTLARNTAFFNKQYGIVAGTIGGNADGGGNKAAQNGQTAQCLYVLCS